MGTPDAVAGLLAEISADWLHQQRWFRSKAQTIRAGHLVERLEIPARSVLEGLEPALGAMFENRIAGSTKGVEAWASWRAAANWRLDAGWVELRQRLAPEPGSRSATTGLGNDPPRMLKLRSALDLTPRHELDVMLRYVGALPNPHVPSYTAVDARFGWQVSKELNLSVLLQNLFDPGHPEWGFAANRAEHQRGIFFKALWRP